MVPKDSSPTSPEPTWLSGGKRGSGRVPVILSVAGSDSGGGAGIQADLKAAAALGVHCATAITAITAQNTRAVVDVFEVNAGFIAAQIDAVVADVNVDAVKTGMLPTEQTVEVVAAKVAEHQLGNLVVDPVLRASTGALLASAGVLAALKMLLPRATVVTPNLAEATALSGIEVGSLNDMREAARRIHALGPRFVVVKGGHLPEGEDAVDVLYDGATFGELTAPRVSSTDSHGTGCTFSAAVAAGLALGMDVPSAAAQAKRLVTEALRYGLRLGGGSGPVNGLAIVYERAGLMGDPAR